MSDKPSIYTKRELRRVGVAVTLIAVLGTIIIIGMTIVMGHYNSLAHSGPKAVVDGVAIGLLIGARGRWRLLALVGVVYGLVLLVQVGLFYLLPIMTLAGIAATAVGRTTSSLHRPAAIALAAITYELIAGTGGAVRIVFGTRGDEPLIWLLWAAELPCRIAGSIVGVALAHRMIARWNVGAAVGEPSDAGVPRARHIPSNDIRERGVAAAAVRLCVLVIATIVPLWIDQVALLATFAFAAIVYGLWAGLRRHLVGVAAMFLFGWLIFGTLSYVWHHDVSRVVELLKTLVLRFLPMTISAVVLVETCRSVDLLRLFRRMGLGPIVLLPLSHVVRQAPVLKRDWMHSLRRLRASGRWFWFFRAPRETARLLVGEPFRKLAAQLIEA